MSCQALRSIAVRPYTGPLAMAAQEPKRQRQRRFCSQCCFSSKRAVACHRAMRDQPKMYVRDGLDAGKIHNISEWCEVMPVGSMEILLMVSSEILTLAQNIFKTSCWERQTAKNSQTDSCEVLVCPPPPPSRRNRRMRAPSETALIDDIWDLVA